MKEKKSVRSKEFMNHYIKIYTGIAVLCVLMAILVGLTVLKLTPGKQPLPSVDPTPEATGTVNTATPESTPTPDVTGENTTTPDPTMPSVDMSKLETIIKNYNDTLTGSLVLVNKDHPFDPSLITSTLVTIRENPDRKITVNGWTDQLTADAFAAFNQLQMAMEGEIDAKNMQLCTTAPFSNQNTESEHATGLATDMKFQVRGGAPYSFSSYQVSEQYEWLKNNAWRFGIVFRYPSDKASVTGNTGEFSHMRYVGAVHSEYMFKNNLVLEEYLEFVKKYNFNAPLSFEANNGKTYYIYHVNANEEGNTTIYARKSTDTVTYGTPVISGTNCGGFIVLQEYSAS